MTAAAFWAFSAAAALALPSPPPLSLTKSSHRLLLCQAAATSKDSSSAEATTLQAASLWSDADHKALLILEEWSGWRSLDQESKDEFRNRFRAISKAVTNDTVALDVVRKNAMVLCYGVPQLEGAAAALQSGYGQERAIEIIQKNPGALTLPPTTISESLDSIAVGAEFVHFTYMNRDLIKAASAFIGLTFLAYIGKLLYNKMG
eukprot:CAMPEP_0179136310 /NCGR_PEP_ID=MMETSP0796-20121207/64949_1 /TAXON_ID=73915 /ORGANISM="Pyrodinium bahamense, Strain pbaha01" /LENGTH=203 /DNA_ID=CAMNT_0020835387 /DNA_START=76 /DNA_END=687 /DNA_ORIENTATION=-